MYTDTQWSHKQPSHLVEKLETHSRNLFIVGNVATALPPAYQALQYSVPVPGKIDTAITAGLPSYNLGLGMFTGVWTVFDGVNALVNAYNDTKNFKYAKAHHKKKMAFIANDYFTGIHLVGTGIGTTVTAPLSVAGITTVAVASAFGAGAAISFALYTWGALAKSLFKLYKVKMKSKPLGFIEDRLKKLEHANKKIIMLAQKGTPKEKAYWQNAAKRFQQEALAVYRAHHSAFNKESPHYKNIQNKMLTLDSNFSRPASSEEISYAEKLLTKQHKKLKPRIIDSISWTFAAIGMTAVGISLFVPGLQIFGVSALLVGGIACGLVSAGIKLYQNIKAWRAKRRAKKLSTPDHHSTDMLRHASMTPKPTDHTPNEDEKEKEKDKEQHVHFSGMDFLHHD